MGKISRLPDESLVKILSFLPTKVSVSTSVLSKRWECVWMWLPKLEFWEYENPGCVRLQHFLDRSLPLLKAPVLECVRFNFSYMNFKPEDVKLWIVVVASQCVHHLDICYISYERNLSILLSSLYTNKSLVILRLNGGILLESVPHNVCLPSLKTLQLYSMTYACEESLQRLLFICPVLEDLHIGLSCSNNMKMFTVIVPSLKRLELSIPHKFGDVAGFVINTPSLEYFELIDQNYKRDYYIIENMPKLVEAYVDVLFPDLNTLLGSITSVKHLTLSQCLGGLHREEVVYGDGFVLNQLEHLKLCVCSWHKSNILSLLLKDSPNLRALEFFCGHGHVEFTCCPTQEWRIATSIIYYPMILVPTDVGSNRPPRDMGGKRSNGKQSKPNISEIQDMPLIWAT